jgi:hypothetical protein
MMSSQAMKPRITLLDGRKISSACAAGGVFMLVLASLLPSRWHPVPILFAGLALIAISHVLTPCRDQITRWWRARISKSSPDRT